MWLSLLKLSILASATAILVSLVLIVITRYLEIRKGWSDKALFWVEIALLPTLSVAGALGIVNLLEFIF